MRTHPQSMFYVSNTARYIYLVLHHTTPSVLLFLLPSCCAGAAPHVTLPQWMYVHDACMHALATVRRALLLPAWDRRRPTRTAKDPPPKVLQRGTAPCPAASPPPARCDLYANDRRTAVSVVRQCRYNRWLSCERSIHTSSNPPIGAHVVNRVKI